MDKKEMKIDKKLKAFVRTECQNAAWNIGVSHYHIDIYYMDEKKTGESQDVVGEMETNRRYLQGSLKLYPQVVEKWNRGEKEQVAEIIHHEIAHLATQHLYDCAIATYKEEGEVKDAWETLTTVVGRMSLLLDEYKKK